MFSAVFKVLALAAVALAIPATTLTDTTMVGNAADAPAVPDVGAIMLCTQPNPSPGGTGCTRVPAASSECISFEGDLESFNRAVTGMQVPHGHVCTVHRNLFCSDGPNNFVVLTGPGFVNFETTPVPNGFAILVPFSRQAGSMICNALFRGQ